MYIIYSLHTVVCLFLCRSQSATVETDDEDATPTVQSQTGSPRFQGNRALWSEDFKKLQLDLKKLQFPRDKIIKYSRELGEGQFGKVSMQAA